MKTNVKKETKQIIKLSNKIVIDDIHDYNSKISRGVGVTKNKKKSANDFRKEKYKQPYMAY